MKFREKEFEIKLTNAFIARLMLKGLNVFNLLPTTPDKGDFCQAWALYLEVDFERPKRGEEEPLKAFEERAEKAYGAFCENFDMIALTTLYFEANKAIMRDVYGVGEEPKDSKKNL